MLKLPETYVTKRRIAVLFLLPGCNMTCEHCITENYFDVIKPAEAQETVSFLKKTGYDNLILGGGEPLTWPHDLSFLVNDAKEKGFLVQIGTNGIKLPENLNRLTQVDRFILPLESTQASVHNLMRHAQGGHHQVILDNLHLLRKQGMEISLSTVVTQMNYRGLTELAQYIQAFQQKFGGIHAWHLYKFIPEGRGGLPNAKNLFLTDEKYHEATNVMKKEPLGFPVFKRHDMYNSIDVDFFWVKAGSLKVARQVQKKDPSV